MVSGYKEKNLHSIKMHYRSIINARDVQQQHVLPKTYYYVKRHDSRVKEMWKEKWKRVSHAMENHITINILSKSNINLIGRQLH